MTSIVLQTRWSAFVIALLAFSNVLLLSLLFYKLVPQLSLSPSSDESSAMILKIMKTTDADFSSVWSISVHDNTRKLSAYEIRNKLDEAAIQEFLGTASSVKFTAGLPAAVVQSLIENKTFCGPTNALSLASYPITQKLSENVGLVFSCFVPMVNPAGTMIGLVAVHWKKQIPGEVHRGITTQIESIIRETFR